MTTSSPINPYEPPREPTPPASFSDRDAVELADLRQRVSELERQVRGSWFIRGNVILKTLAVWAYLLLGYLVFATAIISIVFVIRLISGEWQ